MCQRRAYLGVGVVFGLQLAPDRSILLIGIDQVCDIVANDARAACIYEGLHAQSPALFNQGHGAFNVDFIHESSCLGSIFGSDTGEDWTGGVNDNFWLDAVEESSDI